MADAPTIINNSKEIYELIDTAIKIGLGALISGTATYFVTKSNHKNELSKEKYNRKITMLIEATGIVEIYFKSTYELMDNWYGQSTKKIKLFRDLTPLEKEKYEKLDNNYLKNVIDIQYALAQFNMLGEKYINDLIRSYDKDLIVIRNNIILSETSFPSTDKVLKLIDDGGKIKMSYYDEVKKYFDKLK